MVEVDPVTVQFLKNPDILHWGFEGYRLGEDDWGIWTAVPSGTRRWKGNEPRGPTRSDAVFCAPRDGWWHLHYNGSSSQYSHFVDIVTPPKWVTNHRYEMIDLDLDVVVLQNGTVEVEDEDEFEVHQIRYAYTDEMITTAETETARIVAALEDRDEPFFAVAEVWLSRM